MSEPRRPESAYDAARKLADEGTVSVVATVVEGPGTGSRALLTGGSMEGSLGDADLDARLREIVGAEDVPTSGLVEDGGRRVFLDVFVPRPQLVIFGAVHTAQALDHFARRLGYRVIVTDARRALATRERFPETERIHIGWPDDAFATLSITATTAIAVLSHDPKFDEPALLGALRTPARYIGAVGSRSTTQDRHERLRNAGASDEQIARIRGPIGLDIGGSTPEEMAIAILAEIIAVTHGRTGQPLSIVKGAIRGQ